MNDVSGSIATSDFGLSRSRRPPGRRLSLWAVSGAYARKGRQPHSRNRWGPSLMTIEA
jgi:hypothetical protein